jgi:hypothetical protein
MKNEAHSDTVICLIETVCFPMKIETRKKVPTHMFTGYIMPGTEGSYCAIKQLKETKCPTMKRKN